MEYLYDCIMAISGEETYIGATITDDEGKPIISDCQLLLFDLDNNLVDSYEGTYSNEEWVFYIPAMGYSGKYYYRIQYAGQSLKSNQPIYFTGGKKC